MQNRNNETLDLTINKGIIISKLKGLAQANKMMKSAGLPNHIIERILFEPQKHRTSDWG